MPIFVICLQNTELSFTKSEFFVEVSSKLLLLQNSPIDQLLAILPTYYPY